MSVNSSFSKTCFAMELMCFGCALWDNGIFLLGIQEECSWRTLSIHREEFSSADKACCLVILCPMLALILLAGTRFRETISRC